MPKSFHPPTEWLYPKVSHYFKLGYGDKRMAQAIIADIAKEESFNGKNYSMSTSGCLRVRGVLGLEGTRQQKKKEGAYQDVPELIETLRPAYPHMGARSMVVVLRWEHGIKIPEKDLASILKQIEPESVAARKGARFKRSRFYSAGVMEIFSFDQHDKWKRFGLYLHLGLDPYTGRFHWNKIWWTNRNTALVTSYYLGAVRKEKAIPLLTFSDPGRENNGIAKCHTTLRQRLDPSLQGTIQHKWFHDKMNIKSEIGWARVRRGWAFGFERLLEQGEVQGLIDFAQADAIEIFIFRWLFIPYLQTELDAWVNRQNGSMRRAYKHKILPHGIPDEIHHNPEQFGGKNFSVPVSEELLDEMEALWSPPESPVFELTSRTFNIRAQQFYSDIGNPTVTFDSIWNIFGALKEKFEDDMIEAERDAVQTEFHSLQANFEQDVQVVENPLDEVEIDDSFFNDRLFTDDEDDDEDENINDESGPQWRYQIELTDDEDEEIEVDHYLRSH